MPIQNAHGKSESWGSRIRGSIKSVLFGILLFFGAFAVLWWNEGRAVKTAKGLKEGASQVISLSGNQYDPGNSGKLVHLSGVVSSEEPLVDKDFNLEVSALKLKRKVEVYQWVEKKVTTTEKDAEGNNKSTTTYTYEKQWSPQLISSDAFQQREGHVNPAAFPYPSYTEQVQKATIGDYVLSTSMLNKLNSFSGHSVSAIDTGKVKNATLFNEGGATAGSSTIQKFYVGQGSYANPQIGDAKVSFEIVENGKEYSLIAKQVKNTFEPFTTSTGTTIEMIRPGIASAENMFTAAQKSNNFVKWLLRIGGYFMMFFGLTIIFKPLVVVADVIPFLGNLLNLGLRLFSGVIAFALSFITIAIAWIFYRPVLGLSLLAIGIGTAVFFIVKARKKETESMQP